MQLLQDVFIVENLQVINEGKTKDTMRIRGVFGRCNEKNNNGRIYPTTVLENQLKKVQPLIQERRLCGELDHPSNDTVKLSNASHLITKLEIKGNELIGEAEILKTPAGLTAKALIDGGVRIGISSRGMGTLSEDAQGNKVVNEDYRLVTFDLVADPSTRGAFPTLAESTQSKFARESQSKLQKESNFVIMLKSKFRQEFNNALSESILSEALVNCTACKGRGNKLIGGTLRKCSACRGSGKIDDGKPDAPPPPPDDEKPDDAKPDDAMPDDGSDYEETITPYGRTRRRVGTQFKDTGSYWGNLRATSSEIYRMRALAAEKERQKKAAEAAAKPKVPLGQRIGAFAKRAWNTPGKFIAGLKAGWASESKTEYHRIGMILAESMGLLSEEELVKSTKRTGVAATKEKRKDVPKKTVIQTKGSDSKHVATVKTNPGESTITHEGEKIPKSEFKKRLKATGHKFAKVRNPRSLKMESYGDPDEKVKQRKVSGDWRGHKDTPERPESKENEWVKSPYSPSFHKSRSGKIFRGKRQGTKHHISHITDKTTDKTVELPTKTQRDEARKERQARIAANVKKVSGK